MMDVSNFKISLLKKPTEEDWMWVKTCTLNTVGKTSTKLPTAEWKKKLIEAEHSPIRELWFGFKLEIPYFVSVHLVRHHMGCSHFVQTQRNDRQDKYDRIQAPQGAMVSHIMSVNAAELIQIAHKRLCGQASPETRYVVKKMCELVIDEFPEFKDVLVPLCVYRNGKCTEFNPCGYNQKVPQTVNDNLAENSQPMLAECLEKNEKNNVPPAIVQLTINDVNYEKR